MSITVNDVFAAVAATWDAVPALATEFPGGISRGGKETPAFDYVIFSSITNVRTETTTHSETWKSVFRFEVYTAVSPEQAGYKAKLIADVFDPAELIIASGGAKMQQLRRIDDGPADSGDWKLSRNDLIYDCEWSKPRSDKASP